jgi:hypothetical protein
MSELAKLLLTRLGNCTADQSRIETRRARRRWRRQGEIRYQRDRGRVPGKGCREAFCSGHRKPGVQGSCGVDPRDGRAQPAGG